MPQKKKSSQKVQQGKRNRAAGARFEAKVRTHLESLGWTVSKWMNTVEQEKDGGIWKLVPAKRKYNPFLKALVIGTGFPDFVCFRRAEKEHYEVIAVEVKKNGYLTRAEKDICKWLVENRIFGRILIAKTGKKRGEIDYVDFEKKYMQSQ